MKIDDSRWEKYARRLIVIEHPRAFYLSIPKCGCTFVKNILWRLENGSFHAMPKRVHDDDNYFRRAIDLNLEYTTIPLEPRAFTVLRNPIDRFLSLYFDKVIGSGQNNYVPLARTLSEKRGLRNKPITLNDHQYNLEVMAEWLEANLASEIDIPKEAHWTPQSYRKEIMRVFDLKILTVESLSSQLSLLLASEIPDIDAIIKASETNASIKPVDKLSILTTATRKKVNSIYAGDRRLYRKAKAIWDSSGALTGHCSIPRFSQIDE